jgi:hypothetical protein
MASTVRAHARRRRAGLAAAGAAALITPTAVTATWPGASRQALAGPRSQLPVFVLDKGQFRAFDIPFGEFSGDSVTINDRGQIAGSYRPSAGGACSDTVPLRGFHRPCVPVSLTRSVCRAGLGEAEPDGPDLIPANRTGAQMRESWRPGGDTLRRSGRLEANLPHISHTRSSSRLHRAGVA